MAISAQQLAEYEGIRASLLGRTYRGYTDDVIALLSLTHPNLNAVKVRNILNGVGRDFPILRAIKSCIEKKEAADRADVEVPNIKLPVTA